MGKTRFIIRLSILIILVFAGMVSSCTQEIYPDEDNLSGGMTWVYLDFAPEEVDVVLTKEVQTEATENKIVNFHLFVFDEDGNKLFGKFFDNNSQKNSENNVLNSDTDAWWAKNPDTGTNHGVVKFLSPECIGAKIYIFANLNSDAVRI